MTQVTNPPARRYWYVLLGMNLLTGKTDPDQVTTSNGVLVTSDTPTEHETKLLALVDKLPEKPNNPSSGNAYKEFGSPVVVGLIFIILSLFSSFCFAEIKLKCPEYAVVGELIRVDASESDSEKLAMKIIPETDDFEQVGKRAFLSSRTGGEYLLIIAGSENNEPVLKTHRIYVEPVDDNTAELDSSIRKWLTQVRSDGGKDEARKLAQSFRFIAQSKHTKITDFVEAAAASNRMVLGDSLDAWKPFLDGLGLYLDANPPSSLAKYQETWLKIAESIERHVR